MIAYTKRSITPSSQLDSPSPGQGSGLGSGSGQGSGSGSGSGEGEGEVSVRVRVGCGLRGVGLRELVDEVLEELERRAARLRERGLGFR